MEVLRCAARRNFVLHLFQVLAPDEAGLQIRVALEGKHEVKAVTLAWTGRYMAVVLADDAVFVTGNSEKILESSYVLVHLRVSNHALRGAVFDTTTHIADRARRGNFGFTHSAACLEAQSLFRELTSTSVRVAAVLVST